MEPTRRLSEIFSWVFLGHEAPEAGKSIKVQTLQPHSAVMLCKDTYYRGLVRRRETLIWSEGLRAPRNPSTHSCCATRHVPIPCSPSLYPDTFVESPVKADVNVAIAKDAPDVNWQQEAENGVISH